jgi:hypothetical protein
VTPGASISTGCTTRVLISTDGGTKSDYIRWRLSSDSNRRWAKIRFQPKYPH